MELSNYLARRYTLATQAAYLREIHLYLSAHPQARDYTYGQVMDYIGAIRNKGLSADSLNRTLASVKVYYQYLCDTKERSDHPARAIRLRDTRSRDVQLQDLFTPQELRSLLGRRSRYSALEARNEVILGLLIHQGLTVTEMASLCVGDIHLSQGTLQVRATAKTNGRILALEAAQILLLKRYIDTDRPALVRKDSLALILTKLGTPEKGEGIHYLVSTFQGQFTARPLTPTTIRQSVIAQWLKEGRDIRVVQVMAGHKYPSTTERYQQSRVEELKAAVLRYHPMR
jgi:integrase/recombinase XerD